MKAELIEEQVYNGTKYWIKIDGVYQRVFRTYEEAKEEFDKAICFIPTQTILETKEI